MLGRLGTANIALALAFAIGTLLPPSRFLPGRFFGAPLLHSLGLLTYNDVLVFVNCGLLAVVLYVVLRAARIERFLVSPLPAQIAIALGNALMLFAVVVAVSNFIHPADGAPPFPTTRGFARTVGWWLMLGGLVWLLVRSYGRQDEERRMPVTLLEAVVALVVIGAPCAYVANLLWGKDGAMRRLAAMEARFAVLCASAGEQIAKPVGEVVEAVYFDPGDLITQYYRVQADGTYSGSGWTGGIGEKALATKALQVYERNNEDAKSGAAPYVRFAQGNYVRNQPVQELQSRYAVRTRELLGPEETAVGLKGTEIRVVELRTNETLATSTSYVSTWHNRFCGRVEPDGNFTPAAFVGRALNLRLQ